MCILCDPTSLRLLVVPQDSLSWLDLAESIRIAREAAMQLVLDTADALDEFEGPTAALASVEAEEYVHYIIERAEEDGVADAVEGRAWTKALRRGTILHDARVQAFLAAATEGLAVYLNGIDEKRAVLERFLEVAPAALTFGGIGAHGEISFDYAGERYIVLTDDEAIQIAIDRIGDGLWREDPALLLRYTSLPDDGIGILAAAQQNEQEKANDILAGIVDVALLAEDLTRQRGYARFVAEGVTDDFSEQRFGDHSIVRLRLSGAPQEE
jgi:hypothetical protein